MQPKAAVFEYISINTFFIYSLLKLLPVRQLRVQGIPIFHGLYMRSSPLKKKKSDFAFLVFAFRRRPEEPSPDRDTGTKRKTQITPRHPGEITSSLCVLSYSARNEGITSLCVSPPLLLPVHRHTSSAG